MNPDFKTYRYTKLNTFHKYDSWVGPSEINNIHLKSFDLLKKEYSTLWEMIRLKKTDLYGGEVKFKGGVFYEDEKLLFFDLGMIYYKSEIEESKSFWSGTKLSEIPKKGFTMRYDFRTTHLWENKFISGWGECGGMDFKKVNDEGFEYKWITNFGGRFKTGNLIIKNKVIHECLQEIQKDIQKIENDIISKNNEKEKLKKIEEEIREEKRIDVLKKKKGSILDKFDKDKNGTIDIIEDKNEFNLLLNKHQKVIVEKGKEFNQNYTHQLIKVGNYIKQKRSNIQLIFDCIKQVQNQKDLSDFVKILEGEIHSYNLLLINSLNLIVSLVEDDQITFYDIYERFDKLNIFNSNWENKVSNKLSNLNKGINKLNQNLKGVMYEIRDMGNRIVSSIDDLSYITEESTRMLDNRLGEIDSSIKTNNLLTMIQTYQTYQINKNTKSLRG